MNFVNVEYMNRNGKNILFGLFCEISNLNKIYFPISRISWKLFKHLESLSNIISNTASI